MKTKFLLSLLLLSLAACKPGDAALALAEEDPGDGNGGELKTWIFTVDVNGGPAEFEVCVRHDDNQHDCGTDYVLDDSEKIHSFTGYSLEQAYINNMNSNPAWHTGGLTVTFQEVAFDGTVQSKNTVSPANNYGVRSCFISYTVLDWTGGVIDNLGGC